jgi:hypothetical protein
MRLAIFIIILVCGSLGVAQSTDSHFNLVQTAEATSDRLTPQKSVPIIQEGQIDQGKYTLDIDLDQRIRKFVDLGAPLLIALLSTSCSCPKISRNKF